MGRSPQRRQRHLLDPVQRSPLARPARTLRLLADRPSSLLTLEERRHLGSHPGRPAVEGRAQGLLDYSRYYADTTSVRATRAAGGAVKKGPAGPGHDPRRIRQQVHLVTEARGLPIGLVLTQGNSNECPEFIGLFEQAVADTGRLPRQLGADRGYSANFVRNYLGERGVEAVIPMRKTEHLTDRPALDAAAYKGRNVIERCVGKLKDLRRLSSRFDKLASSFRPCSS